MPATVACDTSPFLRQELRLNWREVPILVNSFNRLDCLRRLIDWLVSARYRRIYVVDNASTYQPLRAYLAEIERLGAVADGQECLGCRRRHVVSSGSGVSRGGSSGAWTVNLGSGAPLWS